MDENLELTQAIEKNVESCGKGLEMIEDTLDRLSRKRKITLDDVLISVLKIAVGGGIAYASADNVKQNVVKIAQNIESARRRKINNRKLLSLQLYGLNPLLFGLSNCRANRFHFVNNPKEVTKLLWKTKS